MAYKSFESSFCRYYHADRLGVLVWQVGELYSIPLPVQAALIMMQQPSDETVWLSQDMPAMFYQAGPQDLSLADKMQFKVELQRIMQQHFNHPWYCVGVLRTWDILAHGFPAHGNLLVGAASSSGSFSMKVSEI